MRVCVLHHVPVLNVGAALQQLLHNVHMTFFSCADQRRPAVLLLPWKQLLVACSLATTAAVEGLGAVCVRVCLPTTSSRLTLAPLLMSSCTMSRLPCSAASMRGVCPFCCNHTQTHSSAKHMKKQLGDGWRRGGPYIVASVHLLEAVQVGSQGRQVLVLHIAEEVLDGQCGHLDGCSGVHVGGWLMHPLLERHGKMHQCRFLIDCILFPP